jgi:hypothetical protein
MWHVEVKHYMCLSAYLCTVWQISVALLLIIGLTHTKFFQPINTQFYTLIIINF